METVFKIRKELLGGHVLTVADRHRVHVLFKIFIIAGTQEIESINGTGFGLVSTFE